MKKITISIPAGIQYLTDKRLNFHFHEGKSVLNKQITGCGATTLALEDDTHDTVVYCPRI